MTLSPQLAPIHSATDLLERQALLREWYIRDDVKAWLHRYWSSDLDRSGAYRDREGAEAELRLNGAMLFGVMSETPPAFVSTPVLQLLSASSLSMPESWALEPSMLSPLGGFVWFQTAWTCEESNLEWQLITWVHLWQHEGQWLLGVPHLHNNTPVDEGDYIQIAFFSLTNPAPDETREIQLLPSTIFRYRVGDSLAEHFADPSFGAWIQNPEAAKQKMRLLATYLSFIRQRILIPASERAPRSSRRRWKRMNLHISRDEVQVIRLRATDTSRITSGPTGPQNWQSRWVVRGHWRDQWYPSRKRHQPKWIASYIKGPSDRPVRNPERVFAVVR